MLTIPRSTTFPAEQTQTSLTQSIAPRTVFGMDLRNAHAASEPAQRSEEPRDHTTYFDRAQRLWDAADRLRQAHAHATDAPTQPASNDRIRCAARRCIQDVGPDPGAFQRVRPKRAGQCDIAGVAPACNEHAADLRLVVARIEGVPTVTEIGLKSSRKVHRAVGRLGAAVAQIARAIACRHVHAPAQGHREVSEVAAHAGTLVVGLHRRARVACVSVSEFNVFVDEIADGLHRRPARRDRGEPLPGDDAQAFGLAVATAQQVDQRGAGRLSTAT